MQFREYDNPQRAEHIWKEYARDLMSYGIVKRAEVIAAECNRADTLDTRLDNLLAATHAAHSAYSTQQALHSSVGFGKSDGEVEGTIDNILNALEE